MERDFLGLKWRTSNENVKDKTRDISDNSVTGYSSFSKKLAPQSQFSPFVLSSTQEDVQRKNLEDSPVFKTLSSSYSFDCNSRIPAHLAENIASEGGHMFASPIHDRPVGGASSVHEQPSISPALGFVNVEASLRNKAESSGSAALLTIFYDNAVYAYDDVSPEKAQAVIRMAKTKELSNPVASDSFSNQAQYCPQICSSHSLQYNSTTYIQRTVTQARKASLDRFLEKRKDRCQ